MFFCTLAWNIFCQFWEGYPISPRLQHHFGSILGWGFKTSSDHCNKSGCNTSFRRMLRLLRKNETKEGELAKPRKHNLQYPTIVVGFFPKNQQFMKTSILTFRLQSFLTSLDLPFIQQLKAFWQICSWGTSKKHRLNVAIANRSESHSPCPAGGKLMNNCTCPTGTFSGAKGGVSLRYSWSWTPGVNCIVETENWCFVIQCVDILYPVAASRLSQDQPVGKRCLTAKCSIHKIFYLYTISLNHYGTRLHSSSALTVVNCLGDWF